MLAEESLGSVDGEVVVVVLWSWRIWICRWGRRCRGVQRGGAGGAVAVVNGWRVGDGAVEMDAVFDACGAAAGDGVLGAVAATREAAAHRFVGQQESSGTPERAAPMAPAAWAASPRALAALSSLLIFCSCGCWWCSDQSECCSD